MSLKRLFLSAFWLILTAPLLSGNLGFGALNSQGKELFGIASFYGKAFAGQLTASGELFDPGLLTAAHRTLPLFTWVRVTNLENLRSVVVRITDRGPYVRDRIIDLSRSAADKLYMTKHGVAKVRIEVLD
jgi:rare lipoprotein A